MTPVTVARSPVRQYFLLCLLFIGAATVQTGNTITLIHILLHRDEVPDLPFTLWTGSRTIANGPFRNDQILAINGRPFHAGNQLALAVDASRPGDALRLMLSAPDGYASEQMVAIPSRRPAFSGVHDIAVAIAINLVVPVFALALGFGVVLIRPRDRYAWLVLLLMVGFMETFRRTLWLGPLPDVTRIWNAFWTSVWPVSMVLFGIYFPTRSARDKRRPWVKYIVLGVFAAIDIAYWCLSLIWQHDISATEGIRTMFVRLYFGQLGVALLATGNFFINLRLKSAAEGSADARRRLNILRVGSWIGLGPVFLLALYAVVSGHDIFSNVPLPLTVSALLLIILFPVTLAYVIVVERAMDLSFVIRTSVRYGFARVGLWAARIVFASVAIYLLVNIRAEGGIFRVLTLAFVAIGLSTVRQRGADRLSVWIDRKFFREAYNSETVLAGLASEVGRFLEVKPLLECVAQRVSATLHVSDIVILLREGACFKTAYSTRPGQPMDIPVHARIVNKLEESGQPVEIHFDQPPLWIRSLGAEELQTLDFMRSRLLLPLTGREGLSGIVSLGPKLSEAPYSDTDIRLLQAVTWQAGMALENSRLVASLAKEAGDRERANMELEIAREVQERLFPRNQPGAPGAECAGYCRPARGVGGDYYDFLLLPHGKSAVAVGDVSGKGIAAALMMASLQASLRAHAISGTGDLALVISNLNRLIYETSTASRYATLFYGEYNPTTRELCYVNAGHNPPIVLRGDNVFRLRGGGPVVGLLPGAEYEQMSRSMEAGDIFIAYTDGISEAMNEGDEEWDEERFIAAARSCSTLSAEAIIQHIFKAADEFTGSAGQFDDMTLVVIKLS